jgi:crotonobetainyl-CoA:carnitine CoA-transferase CaiB-like acyl-CoA transferase
VVDLASFIAGPVISRHLAMLGAEVVKVEPPTGDPFRAIGPLFCSWNQGKRSIAIDLQAEDGRRLMHRLVERADVVVENFRPGVAERLGASASALRAVNPDVVLLSSPGYGADASMADEPAFDPLLQALGGIMASQGGEGEPVFLTVAIHDVVTPLLGAFGIVSALYDRLRTGDTHHVHTSLAHTTVAVQAAEFTRYAGAPPPPLGGFDHGEDGRRAVDGGWQWSDGPHTIAVSRMGLTAEPIAVENDLVVDEVHPGWGPLTVFGQLIGGSGPAPSRCPGLDEHGADIRAELDAP